MLTLYNESQSFCGGLSRRNFLRVGTLGFGGLTLADLLRAATPTRRARSVIMVCLPGGPSHLDTYDMKPDAPAEYRGPFRPIRTNVPGFSICELLPKQATCADKLALVRGVRFSGDFGHRLHEVYTGFPPDAQRPAFGSVVSRLRPSPSLPPYVSLRDDYTGREVVAGETPAYLGAAHRPFTTCGTRVPDLTLPRGMTAARLADRKALLRAFDGLRRDLETREEVSGADALTARALDLVTSPRARDAFDVSREPEKVRHLYGPVGRYKGSTSTDLVRWDPAPFLQARRLVESGVPVVTLSAGGWDHHGAESASNIFESLRGLLPLYDHAIHGLITDLHQRGLSDEVLVLIWGEMGRAPRVTERRPGHPGREHWPEAGFALLAGGGLSTGQVIGGTDAQAGRSTCSTIGRRSGRCCELEFPKESGQGVNGCRGCPPTLRPASRLGYSNSRSRSSSVTLSR